MKIYRRLKKCVDCGASGWFPCYKSKSGLIVLNRCYLCHREKVNQRNRERYAAAPSKYLEKNREYFKENQKSLQRKNNIRRKKRRDLKRGIYL